MLRGARWIWGRPRGRGGGFGIIYKEQRQQKNAGTKKTDP